MKAENYLKVGNHSVEEVDGETLITINETSKLTLDEIYQSMKIKSEVARFNQNRIYPTIQNYESREYVHLLEKITTLLSTALILRPAYVRDTHGSIFRDEMIMTNEDID